MFNSQEKTQNRNIQELKVNITPTPTHFGCNILSKKRAILLKWCNQQLNVDLFFSRLSVLMCCNFLFNYILLYEKQVYG